MLVIWDNIVLGWTFIYLIILSEHTLQEKPTNCWFKAKHNVFKTWNVHQLETHDFVLTLITKFCSICHRLTDVYWQLRAPKLWTLLLGVVTKTFINRKFSHDCPVFRYKVFVSVTFWPHFQCQVMTVQFDPPFGVVRLDVGGRKWYQSKSHLHFPIRLLYTL